MNRQGSSTRIWTAILTLLLLVSLAGCGGQGTLIAKQETDVSIIWGLTEEERLSDFDYFWETVTESYPFWGVVERRTGFVPDEKEYAYYRALAEESDLGLYSAVYSMGPNTGYAGHFNLIEPYEIQEYQYVYEDAGNRRLWYKAVSSDLVYEQYEKLTSWYQRVYKYEPDFFEWSYDPDKNIRMERLEGHPEIAYLYVDSFGHENIEDNQKDIYEFYDSIGDCTDLIIDISRNGGGSSTYWIDLLVAPNIRDSQEINNYALVIETEHTIPYLVEAYNVTQIRPMEELPDLPALLDREGMTGFVETGYTIYPGEYESPFRGNIWVLVSDYVYSASEGFSIFCKQTGFATLVGETNTGGDGIGIDPVLLTLPNSGMVVRYSALYGVNPDGSCNEEVGTEPDLISPEGESALTTVVRAITGQE